MNKIITTSCLILATLIFWGCSAKSSSPQVLRSVEIVNEPVDRNRCTFLGEAVGSQGNWLTGDLTSNKNLMVGARNDLRNQAYKMGGNIVYIQEFKNSSAYKALGTTNTTAIGKVYRCR